MNLSKHGHHHERTQERSNRPDLTRLHHTPLFWVAPILMLVSITVYVMSDDLAEPGRTGHG